MNPDDFKKLYVMMWNSANDHYWVGTVDEALRISQSQFRGRENLMKIWDRTDERSEYLKRELQWKWIAVAETMDKLHRIVEDLKEEQPDQ